MKLSDMPTTQLLDALCAISPALARMGQDVRTAACLHTMADELTAGPISRRAAAVCAQLVPLLLVHHRKDALQVIAVLTGKSEKQLQAQNGMETVADCILSMDEVLARFFASAAGAVQPGL